MKRLVVYVAGPLGDPPALAHVAMAQRAATAVRGFGHVAIVPHLSAYEDAVEPRPRRAWLDDDLEIVSRCDVVLRLPGDSPGADEEVAHAEALGIPWVRHPEDIRAAYDARHAHRAAARAAMSPAAEAGNAAGPAPRVTPRCTPTWVPGKAEAAYKGVVELAGRVDALTAGLADVMRQLAAAEAHLQRLEARVDLVEEHPDCGRGLADA